ncbi:MAG: dockerin type I repeat-containing protein [Candidatus Binatia bacterium]
MIHYYSNPSLMVSGVEVQLQQGAAPGTGGTAAVTQTDSTGQFSLSGTSGLDYRVQPMQPTGAVGNGIDILDAVTILQATTGLITLGAQQQLACDVSGDGSVDIIDAVLILQYTVGLITQFPVAQMCGSDWVFVPEADPAVNQLILQPQVTTGQNGAIAFQPLAAPASNQNFSAVLFGDCMGNWQSSPARVAALSVAANTIGDVRLGQHVQRSGRYLRVPLSVHTNGTFRGLTVQLGYDPTQLSVRSVRPAGNARKAVAQANSQVSGLLNIAVASPDPLPSGVALMLEFETKRGHMAKPRIRVQHSAVAR